MFDHPVPSEIQHRWNPFKGVILHSGNGKCTIAHIAKYLEDTAKAEAIGAKQYLAVERVTREMFDRKYRLIDEDKLIVWCLERTPLPAMDNELYQELIDVNLGSKEKAVFIITIDKTKRPDSGLWNVGLRRAPGNTWNVVVFMLYP